MDHPDQPPQQWQQPPHTGYPAGPPTPPPPGGRRWFPLAVVGAIIIAGLLIAGAVIFSGNQTQPPAAAPSTTAAPPVAVPPESTATCKAWRTTYTQLMAVPNLPAGADYNTPNIDTMVANQNKANEKILIGFEPKIDANDPAQVVSAAKAYINFKRIDMAKSANHTVTEADDTAVDTSFATLNQLCSVN